MDDGGGLYRAPCLYDVVNARGTAAEVAALVRAARRFAARCEPGSVWLEPACGTGRYLRGLLQRGFSVRGYDEQPQMLAYAARRLRRLDPHAGRHVLVHADFTLPAAALRACGPADVACCPVNSLRHLHDDQAVLAHLEQIAALLAPGGVYLVGLDLHDAARASDEDIWIGTRGHLQVTQVVQYLPPEVGSRRERVIVEMVARRPRGAEHHSFAYDLRTYTERQWTALIARSPLRRLAVCDANGRPVPDEDRTARLPYQLEILGRRGS